MGIATTIDRLPENTNDDATSPPLLTAEV